MFYLSLISSPLKPTKRITDSYTDDDRSVHQAAAMSISLPLWKEDAELKGYTLPKNLWHQYQQYQYATSIIVDSIALQGLKIPELNLQAKAGKQKVIRKRFADVWLLPFLNGCCRIARRLFTNECCCVVRAD